MNPFNKQLACAVSLVALAGCQLKAPTGNGTGAALAGDGRTTIAHPISPAGENWSTTGAVTQNAAAARAAMQAGQPGSKTAAGPLVLSADGLPMAKDGAIPSRADVLARVQAQRLTAAAGGVYKSADGKLQAIVPPGALSADAPIKFAAVDTSGLSADLVMTPGIMVAMDLGGAQIKAGQAIIVKSQVDPRFIDELRRSAPGKDLASVGLSQDEHGTWYLSMPVKGLAGTNPERLQANQVQGDLATVEVQPVVSTYSVKMFLGGSECGAGNANNFDQRGSGGDCDDGPPPAPVVAWVPPPPPPPPPPVWVPPAPVWVPAPWVDPGPSVVVPAAPPPVAPVFFPEPFQDDFSWYTPPEPPAPPPITRVSTCVTGDADVDSWPGIPTIDVGSARYAPVETMTIRSNGYSTDLAMQATQEDTLRVAHEYVHCFIGHGWCDQGTVYGAIGDAIKFNRAVRCGHQPPDAFTDRVNTRRSWDCTGATRMYAANIHATYSSDDSRVDGQPASDATINSQAGTNVLQRPVGADGSASFPVGDGATFFLYGSIARPEYRESDRQQVTAHGDLDLKVVIPKNSPKIVLDLTTDSAQLPASVTVKYSLEGVEGSVTLPVVDRQVSFKALLPDDADHTFTLKRVEASEFADIGQAPVGEGFAVHRNGSYEKQVKLYANGAK